MIYTYLQERVNGFPHCYFVYIEVEIILQFSKMCLFFNPNHSMKNFSTAKKCLIHIFLCLFFICNFSYKNISLYLRISINRILFWFMYFHVFLFTYFHKFSQKYAILFWFQIFLSQNFFHHVIAFLKTFCWKVIFYVKDNIFKIVSFPTKLK